MSNHADIGPVSVTTDPEKFQQDLQELFVQVGTKIFGPSLMSLAHFGNYVSTSHLLFAPGFSSLLTEQIELLMNNMQQPATVHHFTR